MSFSKFRMVIYLIVAHVKKKPQKNKTKTKTNKKVPSVKTKTERDKQTKTDKQTKRQQNRHIDEQPKCLPSTSMMRHKHTVERC